MRRKRELAIIVVTFTHPGSSLYARSEPARSIYEHQRFNYRPTSIHCGFKTVCGERSRPGQTDRPYRLIQVNEEGALLPTMSLRSMLSIR
jgi:hypothetical protein